MRYLLLREAGGLGDLLQIGSVADKLTARGDTVELFTLGDPALLTLASMLAGIDRVHPLSLQLGQRRRRCATDYERYPYLEPVLSALQVGDVMIDLYCPAWREERDSARSGIRPRWSRAQCFALEAGIPINELAPPRLKPFASPNAATKAAAMHLKAQNWALVALGSKDPARSLSGSAARNLVADVMERFGPTVVFDYPTPSPWSFFDHEVFWFPGDMGELPDRAAAVCMAVELVGHASRVITVDSFVLHLAAALGKPAALLCGPTDAATVSAHYSGISFPARPESACGPCYYQQCNDFCPECRSEGCSALALASTMFQPDRKEEACVAPGFCDHV